MLGKFLKRLIEESADTTPALTANILKGPQFQIGEYTYGRPGIVHFGENASLKIGRFCSIAENVTIFLGGNHRMDWISTYPFTFFKDKFPDAAHIKGHPATKGDVNIGSDVWIANGATILSGVRIGHGAVIAANSVVTKDVKPYEVVGGNPAVHIKFRFPDEQVQQLLSLQWWDWDESRIAAASPNLCSNDIERFLASKK